MAILCPKPKKVILQLVENTVGVLRVVRTKSFERVINWLRLYIYMCIDLRLVGP